MLLFFRIFFCLFLTSLASELHLQVVWLSKNMVIYCIYIMCLLFRSNKEHSSSSSNDNLIDTNNFLTISFGTIFFKIQIHDSTC